MYVIIAYDGYVVTVSLSYISELACDGTWSAWSNQNSPSIHNKDDSELLEPIRHKLCSVSPYSISNIECEAVGIPQLLISETKDNVTCDLKKGLICTYNKESSNYSRCLDYKIRVCCNSGTTLSPSTASSMSPFTTPTTVEECVCETTPRRKVSLDI